jgi:DNA (cytosine-5)-methyltransferase 1
MGRLKVVSLFAGCGGKDLGFRQAGFDIVWANDVEPAACATYRRNFGPHILSADIGKVSSESIPAADIVIGGFPCQGFSIVGTRRLDDHRNFLYREMKRVIHDKRPAFFVAENVRGLLNMAKGKVIQAMVAEFRELGYEVDYRLLNARDFGVPQLRERVFIIGNRLGLPNPFPIPTHGPKAERKAQQMSLLSRERGLLPYRTLRDAIGGIENLGTLPNHEVDEGLLDRRPEFRQIMPHIGEGQKLCNVRLGQRSVYTWNIPEVFGEVSDEELRVLLAIAGNRRRKEYGPKDGNPLPVRVIEALARLPNTPEILASLVRKKYLVQMGETYELKNAFNGIFRRLRWNEPSEAILTVFHSPRYYLHPSQHRAFSVREVARIQEFPDDFVFEGTLEEQYTQVGNAVPPRLAAAVAREVGSALAKAGYQPVHERPLAAIQQAANF